MLILGNCMLFELGIQNFLLYLILILLFYMFYLGKILKYCLKLKFHFQFLGFLVIYIFIKVIFSFICLLAISSNRNFFVIFHIIINLSFIGLIIYYVYRTYCNFKSRNFSHYYEETDNEVNISPKTDAMKVDESEKNDLSILPLQLNK